MVAAILVTILPTMAQQPRMRLSNPTPTVKVQAPASMPDIAKLHFTETPTGLKYTNLVLGDDTHTPGTGQTAVVQYTGWLTDGRKFDSSFDHGEPFSFRIGGGKVIQGWDEGVSLMGKGGTRVLVIPAKLAYGSRGVPQSHPPIPPNATLVFQITLIDIK